MNTFATTPTTSLFTTDVFEGLDKSLVGYDRIFNKILAHSHIPKKLTNYPPYNIRKTGENTYVIEMAVAGFGESELKITLEDDSLTISGSARSKDDGTEVIHHGLALRDFCHWFTIDDQVVVKNAEMFNGLLNIWLERIIPESKKPKKIEINGSSDKQYLTE
jgi:molecular chaperone IbpA